MSFIFHIIVFVVVKFHVAVIVEVLSGYLLCLGFETLTVSKCCKDIYSLGKYTEFIS